jgi:hypothetical protein
MRNTLALVLGLALVTISCAPAIHVRTDYDRHANFSKYRTFSIRAGNSTGNPVMDQRIKSDVASALRAKGLEEVREGDGDAVVVAHAATRTHRTYETFYDGWDWHWRWGAPEVVVDEFEVGTIVVDMFDPRTKTAVWHGYARHVLSEAPEKNAERADEAVAKIFENFPRA